MKSQTQIGQLKEAMVIDQNARTKANNVKHLSGSKVVGKISVKSDPIDALDYLAEQSRNGNYTELLEDNNRPGGKLFGPKYWFGRGTTYYMNL